MSPSPLATRLDDTFALVRVDCSPSLWSRGVEAARGGLVSIDAVSPHIASPEGELVLQVRSQQREVIPHRVTLFPEEGSWECTCGGADPCEHVAAAVIAVRNDQCAKQEALGVSVPLSVSYRFFRVPGGDTLMFERWLVGGGLPETRLTSTLREIVGGMQSGRRPSVPHRFTKDDFAIDLALGEGSAFRGSLRWICEPLSRCAGVSLDGEPITARVAPPPMWVEVRDVGGDLRVQLVMGNSGGERFQNGLALMKGDARWELCPLPEVSLTDLSLSSDERRALLGQGMVVPRAEIAAVYRLITELIPALERRFEIRMTAVDLPSIVPMTPRITWTVESRGRGELWALPEIVYGEPPCATLRDTADGEQWILHSPRRGGRTGELPARDRDQEAVLRRTLMRQFSARAGTPVIRDGDGAVTLCQRLSKEGVVTPEGFAVRGAATLQVVGSNDGVSLVFSLPFPERASDQAAPYTASATLPATTVIGAWEQGRSFLSSPDGHGVIAIPRDWLAIHHEQVRAILDDLKKSDRLPTHRVPELASLVETAGGTLSGRLAELAELIGGTNVNHYPLPSDAHVSLRDYQRVGFEWLKRLQQAQVGGILADDMGLGKTVQALLTLTGRSLVVCPTSVVRSWCDHLETFRPSLRVFLYHGQSRTMPEGDSVVITTYGLLRRDSEQFTDREWDCVILDESQAIKNPLSQTANAAYRLSARWRLAMTGTPLENSPIDLWSQIRFAIPGLLPSLDDFQEQLAQDPTKTVERLARVVRPFLLRRTKRDVLTDLPPKTEVTLRIPLRDDERAVYQSIMTAARSELLEKVGGDIPVMAVLEAILRLRQSCCDTRLVTNSSPPVASSKIEALMESLDEAIANNHRCLVFSQWTSMLDLVGEELDSANIRYLRLDGTTRDRGGAVAEFQSAEGPPVFLISLKAGGVGLTLTAADHVFVLDPWWNPAVEEQATDRAHRIGQANPVFVYRIIAADTIEDRILELQARKRELARSLIEGGGAGEASMVADASSGGRAGALSVSREELLELLG